MNEMLKTVLSLSLSGSLLILTLFFCKPLFKERISRFVTPALREELDGKVFGIDAVKPPPVAPIDEYDEYKKLQFMEAGL